MPVTRFDSLQGANLTSALLNAFGLKKKKVT